MKTVFLAIVMISTSVFASNPEFDRIYNQYKTTLEDYQVGMTKVEHLNDPSVSIGTSITVGQMVTTESTVILKVDGLKTYEYTTSVDNVSGAVSSQVTLVDNTHDSATGDMLTNLNVVNDVFTADFSWSEADGEYVWIMTGKLVKNLMASGFCDSKMKSTGTMTVGTLVFDIQQENISNCGPMMELEEIKKIDLRNVEFCDETQEATPCEFKDMSFLTSQL